MKRLRETGSTLDKYAEIWITLLALILLIVIVVIWIVSSSDLTAIRDYGLLIAAIIAFPLGFWRSRVAERQADAAQQQVKATQQQLSTAQRQAEAAHRQVETAEQSLLNERYQQGAEMLGNDVLSVRLGGIYALERLATENPAVYYLQITRLLCAFVRNPTQDEQSEARQVGTGKPTPREDVEAAVRSLSGCHELQHSESGHLKHRLDLTNSELAGTKLGHTVLDGTFFDNSNLASADLQFATLSGSQFLQTCLTDADLSNADLSGARFLAANLSNARLSFTYSPGAEFINTDLSSSWLAGTDLSNAKFIGSKLAGAVLHGVNLSGAELSASGNYPASGLTQTQLNEAEADLKNPPRLKGVVDAETGKPLEWRGKPLHDQA